MGDRLMRALIALGLTCAGAISGLFAGGFLVPSDAGLAGGAIVLFYGVLGLSIGLIAGVVLAFKLAADALRAAAAVAVLAALASAAAMSVQITRARAEREAREQGDTAARLAPFTASAEALHPADGASFVTIALNGQDGTFEMMSGDRPGQPVCRGWFDEESRVSVLTALRAAEDYLAEHPDGCQAQGDMMRAFRWTLPERGGEARAVYLARDCGGDHPALSGLYTPFERIGFQANRADDGLVCDPAVAPATDAWSRADAETVRVPPSSFADLPAEVVADLERRNCRVPQTHAASAPHNVRRGRFVSADLDDWAVLCFRGNGDTILVYVGGDIGTVHELARRPSREPLMVVDEDVIGYTRHLSVAPPARIAALQSRYPDAPWPSSVDRDGIEDALFEAASIIWYWDDGRWLQLPAAD